MVRITPSPLTSCGVSGSRSERAGAMIAGAAIMAVKPVMTV
jgi:hypothetical protein